MNIEVKRSPIIGNEKSDVIFGTLYINGILVGYTLERGSVMIPIGNYKAEIYDSPEFGTKLVRLLYVPGREGIEIHPGNYPTQTRGCILIGCDTDRENEALIDSRICFRIFMKNILTLQPNENLTVSIQQSYSQEPTHANIQNYRRKANSQFRK